jgi:hypothetical protein
MQILRQLIREQIESWSAASGAAIAFFSPFPDYIVFVAYDVQSLNGALFGDIEKPTVYSTLYLYSDPFEHCNGAFQVSRADSSVPRAGWGSDVHLAAIGTLGTVMPDRHSNTVASTRTWLSLIRRNLIVGEPLPDVCLGDEIDGVRGYEEPALNMSYSLAGSLPAHVMEMLELGQAHRKKIEESELLELAQDLLVGRV